MARRGPQPKPTRLKLLEGNPGKQRLNQHEPVPIRALQPPPIVQATPAADAEWRRVVSCYMPGFYTDADRPVLTVFCMAWARWLNAHAILGKEGMMTTGSTGQKVAHPILAQIAREEATMLRAADHLAQSPAARARIDAPPPMTGVELSSVGDPDDELLRG